ncbi:hypothetical protein DFH08DRAFT_936609 [Mycena albidolilacea]|uniref:F-box domain-containing protein n=1 Tax=Mycena albidolilacea TaxID=1033008 RepID=A0AAD7A1V1_9AGAR|nr:hypothetical protein DFH08DRAFT_936609 [Mycena albidolilacea]
MSNSDLPSAPGLSQNDKILSLLRSNADPPVRYETESTLSKLSNALRQYDAEIERLEAQVTPLSPPSHRVERGHADITQFRLQLGRRGLSAPIRHVPFEVLTRVFALCAPVPYQELEYVRPFDLVAQKHLLHLAGVCSRWRGIALGTPTLWSTIFLNQLWSGGLHRDTDMTIAMRLLQICLERSGKAPLTVYLYGYTHEPALRMLVAHCERWKTLDIWSSQSTLQSISAVTSLPILENLKVLCCDFNYNTTSPERKFEMFRIVPRLQALEIDVAAVSVITIPPLSRLRKVSLLQIQPDEIAPALAIMPSIPENTHFTLEPLFVPETSSNVASLCIAFHGEFLYSEPAFQAILPQVTFPRLRALAFETKDLPLVWLPTDCGQFITRHPHLRSLSLSQISIEPDDLLHALEQLPSLEELAISDFSIDNGREYARVEHVLITDTLLWALTRHPNVPLPLIPGLHTTRAPIRDHPSVTSWASSPTR